MFYWSCERHVECVEQVEKAFFKFVMLEGQRAWKKNPKEMNIWVLV